MKIGGRAICIRACIVLLLLAGGAVAVKSIIDLIGHGFSGEAAQFRDAPAEARISDVFDEVSHVRYTYKKQYRGAVVSFAGSLGRASMTKILTDNPDWLMYRAPDLGDDCLARTWRHFYPEASHGPGEYWVGVGSSSDGKVLVEFVYEPRTERLWAHVCRPEGVGDSHLFRPGEFGGRHTE